MARVIKAVLSESVDVLPYERDHLEAMSVPEEDSGIPLTPEDILARSRSDAEAKVKEAYAEGRRRGFDAGKAQYAQSVAASEEALSRAAGAIERAFGEFLASMTPEVASLAAAIAAQVLGREAQMDIGLVQTTVRRAIEALVTRDKLVVRLNPKDLEALHRKNITLLEDFNGVKRLDVVADESVAAGGCVVDSETLHVDARLDAQIQNLLTAMME